MKNLIILSIISFLPFSSMGQRNFHRFSAGIGGGLTDNRGDLNAPQTQSLIMGSIDYHFSPYINAGIEIQSGKLAGQETQNYYRFYQNNYKSVAALTRIHLGQFIRTREVNIGTKALIINSLKGIYAGTGFGMIFSRQNHIYREAFNFATAGADQNTDFILPICVGIDNSAYKGPFIAGIGYQVHFAMGDQIDGYYAPGSSADLYSTLIISLKLKFGTLGIF